MSGPAVTCPHGALATGRGCTTPQSPVETVTGTPLAAAVSSPGSLARISARFGYVASPVPLLTDMTLARCRLEITSRAFIISGIAIWLAASSWLVAGVTEMTIFAYGAIR